MNLRYDFESYLHELEKEDEECRELEEKKRRELEEKYHGDAFVEAVKYFGTSYPPRLDADAIATQEVRDALENARITASMHENRYGFGIEVDTEISEPWLEYDPEPSRIVIVRRRCGQCGKRVADLVIDWDHTLWTGERILMEGVWVNAVGKKLCGCPWPWIPKPTVKTL